MNISEPFFSGRSDLRIGYAIQVEVFGVLQCVQDVTSRVVLLLALVAVPSLRKICVHEKLDAARHGHDRVAHCHDNEQDAQLQFLPGLLAWHAEQCDLEQHLPGFPFSSGLGTGCV